MYKKNLCNKKRTGMYVIGSIAMAVGAFITFPKIIEYLSKKIYINNSVLIDEDEDEWGPEIIRREKVKEDEPDGDI